jgi:hypothetical protein
MFSGVVDISGSRVDLRQEPDDAVDQHVPRLPGVV